MPGRILNATIDRLGYIARTYTQPTPVHFAMLAALEAAGFHQGDVGPDGDWNNVLTAWFWQLWSADEVPYDRHWEALTKALAVIRPALGSTPVDRYLPWVAQQVNRMLKEGRDWDETYEISMKLVRSLRAIAEWANAEGVDLNTVDAETALERASEYGEDIGRAKIEQGTVVMAFQDGYTIQVLDTDEQLDGEGEAMQHCVGRYRARAGDVFDLSGDRVKIYSLRDEKGLPHATIELDANARIFTQIRGKQNVDPAERYWPYIGAFIEEFDVGDAPAPDYVLSMFQEAYEEAKSVESAAKEANALMQSAAEHFEKREFAEALADAENATSLESEYGDDPATGPVLGEIKDQMENLWKAGRAAAKEIRGLTEKEHEDIDEAFDDAIDDYLKGALEVWKSDDPRLRPVIQALDDAHEDAEMNVHDVADRQDGLWTGLDWEKNVVLEHLEWDVIEFTYDSSTFYGVAEDDLEELAREFAQEHGLIAASVSTRNYVNAASAAPAYQIAA